MWCADNWKDYELIDTSDGERLERWGKHILVRPDPQIIWKGCASSPLWKRADGVYRRSNTGGGAWVKNDLPAQWQIGYGDDLKFVLRPMGFKHTGLFPEQAANWDWFSGLIRKAKTEDPDRQVKVLNLFAYTGGATMAAARAGAFAAALAQRDAPVFSLACPALVRIAEGDIIGRKRAVTRTLAPLFSVRPTAIVLGCTHFSLLQPIIAAHFPSAYILDAAACAASATAAYVMAHAAKEEAGRTLFFTTGAPAPFSGKASRILGYSTHAEHLPFPIPM